MEKYKKLVRLDGFYKSTEISKMLDGNTVRWCGMVEVVRETTDKNGNKMAFVDAVDEYGKIRILVFASKYPRIKGKLKPDNILVFDGNISKGAILLNHVENPDKF